MNHLRYGLALAGFALALLSIARDDHRIAWAAIALLAASLVVRLVRRKGERPKSQGGDDL